MSFRLRAPDLPIQDKAFMDSAPSPSSLTTGLDDSLPFPPTAAALLNDGDPVLSSSPSLHPDIIQHPLSLPSSSPPPPDPPQEPLPNPQPPPDPGDLPSDFYSSDDSISLSSSDDPSLTLPLPTNISDLSCYQLSYAHNKLLLLSQSLTTDPSVTSVTSAPDPLSNQPNMRIN